MSIHRPDPDHIEIARTIRSHHLSARTQSELQLQDALEALFFQSGFSYRREFHLSVKDSPEFWFPGTGVVLEVRRGLDGLQKRCFVVIQGELDWTKKVHDQVTGRALRPGQESPVTEVFPITNQGSDPFLCHLIGIKEAQSDGILLSSQDREVPVNIDMGRVKQMAEDFLKRKGVPIPSPKAPGLVSHPS